MVVRDAETGRLQVVLLHDEFMDMYHRWQQKPETKALFDKIAAERRATVKKILAEIKVNKK